MGRRRDILDAAGGRRNLVKTVKADGKVIETDEIGLAADRKTDDHEAHPRARQANRDGVRATIAEKGRDALNRPQTAKTASA